MPAAVTPQKALAHWEKALRQLEFRYKHRRVPRLLYEMEKRDLLERINIVIKKL